MEFDVVIVDDHSLVLEGLKGLLKGVDGIRDICVVKSGAELFSLLQTHVFHIYIVDLELPDMDGFELIRAIRKQSPPAKIVVSTMHEEVWIINKLKQADVDAVVFKSSASGKMQEAIQAVIRGNTYYCPRYLKLCREKEKIACIPDTPDSVPTLRELDVLKAIAKGMNTHEISEHLYISENTVEWHRKNLMLKFGARNATDLVVKALAKGYLSIPL